MQTNNYEEHEVKILDVNVEAIKQKLESLGAKKVFDAQRVLTTFDTEEGKFRSQNKIVRLTEEGKLKLSVNYYESEAKASVKVFTSRAKETIDLLKQLEVFPIAKVTQHRVSYELGKVDFDIDTFPNIPSFLEIDVEHLEYPLEELLGKLGLTENKVVNLGTEAIFKEYGLDYFELFGIK